MDFGTHFVAFSSTAIEVLVPYLYDSLAYLASDPEGGNRGVDAAYMKFREKYPDFNTYLACPKLVYQRPSRTDISAPHILDRLSVTKLFVVYARKVKRHLKKLGVV